MIPVSGMALVTPPDDNEGLEGEHRREPVGQELGCVVLGEQGDLDPPVGEGQEGEQDRRRPEQAELAGYRGEDEVGLDLGDGLGEAGPEPGTEQPAVGDVEDALEDLEPRPVRVPPRVDPALHPNLHVLEEEEGHEGAQREEDPPSST